MLVSDCAYICSEQRELRETPGSEEAFRFRPRMAYYLCNGVWLQSFMNHGGQDKHAIFCSPSYEWGALIDEVGPLVIASERTRTINEG